ncbi:sigma-70 family RNA polymerase sigma factor [Embleya sp. MST-111070]|uniref:sigma-70 family RNA polymerase sigma factor n=1 Tax=Embleya sp. MST-111070 TaxID=3398231 RepID=UPI003F73E863
MTDRRNNAEARAHLRAETDRNLTRLATLEPGTHAYARLRNDIVEDNLNLVAYACARYTRRTDLREDLRQVAAIGLIKAVDGYRPGRGSGFLAYAVPTIAGELKRYFRDHTWAVHACRGEQELYLKLVRARDELGARLGRDCDHAELARHLDLDRDTVRMGLELGAALRTESLDTSAPETERGDGGGTGHDRHGAPDPALDLVVDRESLRPLIAELGERDRRILKLRFWDDLTQAEIGDRLGLSQMHVSRLLSRAFTTLRAGMLGPTGAGSAAACAVGAKG